MTLTGAQNNQKRGKRAEYDDDRAEIEFNPAAAATAAAGAKAQGWGLRKCSRGGRLLKRLKTVDDRRRRATVRDSA